jgi:hypothetical protein
MNKAQRDFLEHICVMIYCFVGMLLCGIAWKSGEVFPGVLAILYLITPIYFIYRSLGK